jgi:16S rRNA (cytosine1402-N4)-methyltransferase
MAHISVLKDETIDGLAIHSGDIILDGTLGGGGHTAEIVKRFGNTVKIIGLDLDADALPRALEALGVMSHDTVFRVAGFQDLDIVLDSLNIPHVDRIMLDLGISSFQLEDAGRGFSFKKDEPLVMTMKRNPEDTDVTAYDVVNTWEEKTLADIIYGFGEEKFSRKIAHAIVEARKISPIKTTFDLVDIIDSAVGRAYKRMKIHPATRTFQAIRIATNRELQNIEEGIAKGFTRLEKGGRMAVITFHSLEDRIVKHAFVGLKNEGHGHIVTKKPIVPSEKELQENPRARSAKLRIIEKI